MSAKPEAKSVQATVFELLGRGMREMAREVAEDNLEANPKDSTALGLMAKVWQEFGDYQEVGKLCERAVRLSPRDGNLHSLAAVNWFRAGEYEKALASLSALRAIAPSVPEVKMEQARVMLRLRGPEAAQEILDTLPAGHANPRLRRLIEGLILGAQKRDSEAETALVDAATCEDLSHEQRWHAWFEAAKIRDRNGDYDGAWHAATEGHQIAKRNFDIVGYEGILKAIQKVFAIEQQKQWAHATKPDNRHVFIVGMPRSGTSLLEQILSMHPAVANAGELSTSVTMQRRVSTLTDSFLQWPKSMADLQERDADALQRVYQDAVAGFGPGKERITNKSLVLHHHMGLLSLALPGCHSIMLHRHPLDNMVSCYTTDLVGSGHYYCSNLETLARVWVARREMQEFWSQNLENPPMQLHYEQLVADQETQTRGLLAHLELPWHEACMAFHKSTRKVTTISHDQVTRKMYGTSRGRWRNYEKQLEPAMNVVEKYL